MAGQPDFTKQASISGEISNVTGFHLSGNPGFINHALDIRAVGIAGGIDGASAHIYLRGKSNAVLPGQMDFQTPNAALAATDRLTIGGAANIVAATWTAVYQVGMKFGLAGTATGAYTMDGATSGVVTVTVAAAAGTWTMTLPTAAGTANYFLVTNGSGVTSWSNTLVAPALGAATATSINGLVITATAGTLTIPNSASAALVTSGNYSITLIATAATSVTLPTSGTLVSSVTTGNGVSATNTAGALAFTLGVITPTSVNGLTLTAAAVGFTIAGGTTSKTLTISNTLTLTATDDSTLAIGAGGTLGSAAYTASTAYEAAGGIATHAALTATHGATGAIVGTTNTQAFATGIKTFNSSILAIRNPADTFKYVIVGGAIIADRNLTLPLLTGDDVLVTADFIQTLTNKTLTSPVLTTPDINGGTADSLTSLGVRSTGAAYDLKIASAEVLTAGKTLTIVMGDTDRTLTLGASPSLSGSNTGDNAANSSTMYIGTTGVALNRASAALTLASITLTTPDIGVASATSLATSAAIPFLLTNGQLVNIALTSQTVGATTLTIPDFASVVDEFTFKTKAQTMANKTLTAPTINGTIATTGLTLPSVTLGAQTKLPASGIILGTALQPYYIIGGADTANDSYIVFYALGHANTGRIQVFTYNGTTAASRLTLSGGAATAVATWAAIYHVGMKFGLAGTATGAYTMDGATSGVLTITVPATITDYTLTLPAAANANAGYQLTCAGADTITSWAAAGSLRELKDIIGEHSPQDALDKILRTRVYDFHYKEGKGTGDRDTLYTGIMADEAPWAMHYKGGIVNPVNTLGFMVLGFKAHEERIRELERELVELKRGQ